MEHVNPYDLGGLKRIIRKYKDRLAYVLKTEDRRVWDEYYREYTEANELVYGRDGKG